VTPAQPNGILETALYVADPERSARFYHATLGFEIMVRGDRLIALSVAAGQVLLLFKKGASVNLPVGPHDGDGRLHLAFAIPAADLAGWEAHLARQGVKIEERRRWERGGVSVYLRDPDGHLVELATPGVWPNY
jgi:catechol 2,3-dioxygenase-like lactoylglutathione lyase family enzyme